MELTHVAIEEIGTRLDYLKGAQPVSRRPIGSIGVPEPLHLAQIQGRLELIDGFKRLRALKAPGASTAPVIIHQAQIKEAKCLMLQLNCRRRTINFYEEAVLLADLAKTEGLTPQGIARRLARRKNWGIRRLGFIHRLSEELKSFVQSAQIGPLSAYQLSRLPPSLQMPLFVSWAGQKLTACEVEAAVALILSVPTEQRLAVAQVPRIYLAEAQRRMAQSTDGPQKLQQI